MRVRVSEREKSDVRGQAREAREEDGANTDWGLGGLGASASYPGLAEREREREERETR